MTVQPLKAKDRAKRLFRRSIRFNLLAPYAIAALLTGGLWRSQVAESLDLLIYDVVTEARPARSADDVPITIINISESDISRQGWPIDDRLFCDAMDRLVAMGATAIGLDIYRNVGVGPDQECLRQRARELPQLVTIFNAIGGVDPVPGTPPERQAYNDMVVDADGVIRRDLVHVGGQDEATVALPLRLASIHLGMPDLPIQVESGALPIPWLNIGAGGYQEREETGAGYQKMMAYHQPGSFRNHNISDLLDGKVPEEDIRGRVVFIGSTAPSLRDSFEVPHSRFRTGSENFLGDNKFLMPGVELHSHRLASILSTVAGNGDRHVWTSANWLDRLLLGLSVAGGLLLGESVPSLRRGALLGGVVIPLLLAGGALLVWMRVWVGLVLPTGTMLIWAGAGWVRRGAASQQQRQQIQKLLGQTTSPEVAAQLWAQRDELLSGGRFEGRQIPVTILFTDIAGFTTVSEGMKPPELLAWLNRGMERFVPAITERSGMVNKFTGDGLLAVFGAPLSGGIARDAQAAVEAAQAIREHLRELNMDLSRQGLPTMRMRIGIHTGDVLAGSMGSRERLEYAVIGDTVNCASRLESIEKSRQGGVCRVLASSTTCRLLNDQEHLNWQAWGKLQVKGRSEPLDIWELAVSEPAAAPGTELAAGPASPD
ncbi:CHASE2 domain-containing protein [Synechococcus sp. RSCCF101]|uniref:CHASE2 domain-containing protein n=1 Tax=Synechococcus sp. RSCCF101 TaxID=2511069 RepID=UPI001780B759|nr:adenylate/guanylate cyclase domain-containing protein [Synechococcus sp. RSCCF101]